MKHRRLKIVVCISAIVMVFAIYSTAFAASYKTFYDINILSDNTFSQISETAHTDHSPYYSNYKAVHDGTSINGKHLAMMFLNSGNTGWHITYNSGYFIWTKRACQTGRLYIENSYAPGHYLTVSGGYELLP